MSDPFIGEIKIVGFNFAPTGWTFCDGQLLSIAQNSALFSLIGTYYGGNGTTNFALPDLRGRAPMHRGSGPGLSPRTVGEVLGIEYNVLTTDQMPNHTHGAHLACATTEGDRSDPTGAFVARTEEPMQPYAGSGGATMAAGSVQIDPAGGVQPVYNMPPSLVMNFVIALVGIYPSRS